ncbi:MAG: DUF192 domain-containing protein [Parvularculales bacterium]
MGAVPFFVFVLFFSVWSVPSDSLADLISDRIPETLVIETSEGKRAFTIEIARTPNEQKRGLMFRASLPENHGMLFAYRQDQEITMWMANTPIPLDILFIRRNGKIAKIETMTEPYSRKTISSGVNVRAVLEIAGGGAERLGIKSGDIVRHDLFAP